jgi:MFS transporter, PPP family, 3-phenylpropionic acid transporter
MISGLFYFLYFAAFGIYIPYWTLYLKYLQLSPVQIATVYSVPSICRIFLPPVYGYFADRFRARKQILVIASTAQIVPLLLLPFVQSYPAILILISLFSVFNAAVLPFTEATVQEEQEKGNLDYGRTRLWGTLSFVLLAAVFGKFLERLDQEWILYGLIFFLSLFAIFSFFQPPGKITFDFAHESIKRILIKKSTWVFLLCVLLMHASQGAYYGFFSIHLADLGFRDSDIGIQWAAAATSELTIFFFASVILNRFSFSYLFRICLLLAALRWYWIYQARSYFWLTLSQGMHAFSFGLFHITCLRLIHTIFPEGFRSIGQALLSSMGWGLGTVLGVLISGYLWEEYGAATYLFSSGIAITGFVISFLLRPRNGEIY